MHGLIHMKSVSRACTLCGVILVNLWIGQCNTCRDAQDSSSSLYSLRYISTLVLPPHGNTCLFRNGQSSTYFQKNILTIAFHTIVVEVYKLQYHRNMFHNTSNNIVLNYTILVSFLEVLWVKIGWKFDSTQLPLSAYCMLFAICGPFSV
jgi:hypothetical protein